MLKANAPNGTGGQAGSASLQPGSLALTSDETAKQGAGRLNLEGAVRLAQALRNDLRTLAEADTVTSGQNLLASGRTLPVARTATVTSRCGRRRRGGRDSASPATPSR